MKYSILIPTHNRPHLIVKVVDAFKNLKDSEIIIVENNPTVENKNKYSKIVFPENVRFFSIESKSLSHVRVFAAKQARGEYLFNIDDDDKVLPEFINLLNNTNFECDLYRFPYIRNGKKTSPLWFGKMKTKSFFNTVEISTFLIKKKYFDSKDLFNQNITFMEDQWFAARLFEEGIEQSYIDCLSIEYDAFRQDESITRGKRNDSFFKVLLDTHSLKDENLFLMKALRAFMQNKNSFNKKTYMMEIKKACKKLKWDKRVPVDYKIWFLWLRLKGWV